MRKSPPTLILLVFLLTISLVTPTVAGVNDNVLNSSLEQTIGSYDDTATARTLFGMLQKIVTMLTTMSAQISDVQTMKTDIAEMSGKLDSIRINVDQVKNDASVSAMQTYVTLLSDYQQNGTNSAAYTDLKTWDSLCRSATMINSLKFNGEALDYWISKGYDLEGYFGQIDGFPSSLFRGMTTAAEVMNNEACLDAILGNKTTCYALANSQQLITASNSISEPLKQKIRSSSMTQTACTSSRLLRWATVFNYSASGSYSNSVSNVSTNVNCFYISTWQLRASVYWDGAGYINYNSGNGETYKYWSGNAGDGRAELSLYSIPAQNNLCVGPVAYTRCSFYVLKARAWVDQYGIYF